MEIFDVIMNAIQTSFRNMGEKTWGGIIFGILMVALLSFLFATKGSKKEKFIKNYFLFYLSILLAIIGVVLTLLLNNYIG